jgi:hypothetical protein
LDPKNDAYETPKLVYSRNVNTLMQYLTINNKVDRHDMSTYEEWPFKDINDAHEMTLPSLPRFCKDIDNEK